MDLTRDEGAGGARQALECSRQQRRRRDLRAKWLSGEQESTLRDANADIK
jgi:hypothetical protein